MDWLSSNGSSNVPNLAPDALVNKLTPMLGLSKELRKCKPTRNCCYLIIK